MVMPKVCVGSWKLKGDFYAGFCRRFFLSEIDNTTVDYCFRFFGGGKKTHDGSRELIGDNRNGFFVFAVFF